MKKEHNPRHSEHQRRISPATAGSEPKILHLTLKKKWFDMIASGAKKEEYRELKPYWIKRLNRQTFDIVHFRHGYQKDAPELWVHCKKITIGIPRPEWSNNWSGEAFIIQLGSII